MRVEYKAGFLAGRGKSLLAGALVAVGYGSPSWAQAPLPVVTTVDDMLGKTRGIRYHDRYLVPLPGADGAYGYDVLRRIDSVGLAWQLRRYVQASRQLVLEQFFTGPVPGIRLEGPSREWYASGQLREELTYRKGLIVGTFRTFYPNGQVHRTQSVRSSATACYDSVGKPLARCPEYHTFARLRGKNTLSNKLLNLVQATYGSLLPAGYRPVISQVIYYAFRVDSTGVVRDARLLTAAAPQLETAILQAIAQLPSFEPARLEGQPTDDVIEGYVMVKASRP